MRTSLNHQSEAQNPKCSVIHKLLPITPSDWVLPDALGD